LPKRLGYAEFMHTLRSSGNGPCDIFEIDAAEIGFDAAALHPAAALYG